MTPNISMANAILSCAGGTQMCPNLAGGPCASMLLELLKSGSTAEAFGRKTTDMTRNRALSFGSDTEGRHLEQRSMTKLASHLSLTPGS